MLGGQAMLFSFARPRAIERSTFMSEKRREHLRRIALEL
jgi:hypothetical protein